MGWRVGMLVEYPLVRVEIHQTVFSKPDGFAKEFYKRKPIPKRYGCDTEAYPIRTA